jgi:transcriptional regulator with XRE-family HTH domain
MASHYLREWRKHRHLTQDQVVDRLAALDDPNLPSTAASLSRLENGKQPYSERILGALAEIYDTRPGHLIERNPMKEGEVVDFLAHLNESQQRQVLALIEAMKRETA